MGNNSNSNRTGGADTTAADKSNSWRRTVEKTNEDGWTEIKRAPRAAPAPAVTTNNRFGGVAVAEKSDSEDSDQEASNKSEDNDEDSGSEEESGEQLQEPSVSLNESTSNATSAVAGTGPTSGGYMS